MRGPHLLSPSWAGWPLLTVSHLSRDRQGQAVSAVAHSVFSSVLVHCLRHKLIPEPPCSCRTLHKPCLPWVSHLPGVVLDVPGQSFYYGSSVSLSVNGDCDRPTWGR